MQASDPEALGSILVMILIVISFISATLVFQGILVFIKGIKQIYTPAEAAHDKNHPQHEQAVRLYRYQLGGTAQPGWTWAYDVRRPWRKMLGGLTLFLLFTPATVGIVWLVFHLVKMTD